MIELKHVQKKFEDSMPLKDVNCVINDGDVISIIGPSGTGKSTLLKCINMLGAPTGGEIYVDGECITAKGYDVCKARKKIGMVFQSFNLFSHLTIIENIMKPQIDLLKRDKQVAYDKAIELLKTVGLEKKALQYPDQLSGGQQQRVAICRTLAMDPEIILFDEPTSALDPTMVNEVESVIKDLAKKGHTMMIVTHEMRFAKSICNRVFYMDEGGIYEDGSPEQVFDNPLREKTKRFVKQLRILEFNIDDKDYDFQEIAYKIIDFGMRNKLDISTINRISTVFEELGKEIIIPQLKDDFKLNVVIEHSENSGESIVTFRFNKTNFDLKNNDNILSLKLFRNSVSSYDYETIDEDGYANKIVCHIK